MCIKSRIEYLVCTMCVFITAFVIYGSIGLMQPVIGNSRIVSFFAFGYLGGFAFSMVLSGIVLTVSFIRKRSLKFKIIASLLWFITFACCAYVGIFGYFPYQIYNLVKIIKNSDGK